jgi:2-polyprenyl-6-methoxyphenol hydroxylase-like FAD-dependent oxidoreductase
MPPIGGQNMNIGFGDAELAVWCTRKIKEQQVKPDKIYHLYHRKRKRAALSARMRAYFMMRFGTSSGKVWDFFRRPISYIFLHSLLMPVLVSIFTMVSIPGRNLKNYEKIYNRELGL